MKSIFPKGTDLSHVFNHTIRRRRKGDPRPGTKTKKQRASRERAFQAELRKIRDTLPPELVKEGKIPAPQVIKPKAQKKSFLDGLKERFHISDRTD